MEQSTVEQRVLATISEVLKVPPEKLARSTRFKEDLKVDSLDLAMLVMALEEEFNNTIPDGQEARLTTVGAVVEFIALESNRGG